MALSDAERFLLAFHKVEPGCTSRSLSRGRTSDGGSSYDLLADSLPAEAGTVVDLGCGDGHLLEVLSRGGRAAQLAGIDLSPEELGLAAARADLSRVALARANARSLPFADSSISHVLSHLTLMLMSPIEAVLAELCRVLEPGGSVTAIVGGGPRAGDAFEIFLEELQPLYSAARPIPSLGDRRTRRDEGILELFSPSSGFAGRPTIDDFYLDLSGDFDMVWESLSTLYNLFVLDEPSTAILRARFRERCKEIMVAGSLIPCTMALRKIAARVP